MFGWLHRVIAEANPRVSREPKLQAMQRIDDQRGMDRTSMYRQRDERIKSDRHVVLVIGTSDRFGDMENLFVATMEVSQQRAHILAFVLSCRVFGYSIERIVLTILKQIARERGVTFLEGQYKATAENMPCRDFRKDNGFVVEDGLWVCDLCGELPSDAEWLTVIPQRFAKAGGCQPAFLT
jgi:hypothetical protein